MELITTLHRFFGETGYPFGGLGFNLDGGLTAKYTVTHVYEDYLRYTSSFSPEKRKEEDFPKLPASSNFHIVEVKFPKRSLMSRNIPIFVIDRKAL